MYTYNAYRLIIPLILFLIGGFFYRSIIKNYNRKYISIVIFLFVITIPLILFTFSPQGTTRLSQTSALGEYQHVQDVIKIIFYPLVLLKNYLSYFSLEYLFLIVDKNIRYYISKDFGLFFHWQLPFLLIGVWQLIRLKEELFAKIIIGLLLITPIPAALTVGPNVLRAFLMVIPFCVIISLGIIYCFQNVKVKGKIIMYGLFLFAFYEFALYTHIYFKHFPTTHIALWGGAQKEIVQEATIYSKKYNKIVINTTKLADEHIYFLFYNNQLKPLYVDSNWRKPSSWKEPILYISYPGVLTWEPKMLKEIRLNTPNREVVAQFWEL